MDRRFILLGVEVLIAMAIIMHLASASNFQTIVLTRNLSWYNTSIMVCSTNTTVCSDVWIQNFTSATNASNRVLTLEGFNSTYDTQYFLSAYLDGTLAYNNTRSYLGRSSNFGIQNITTNGTGTFGSLSGAHVIAGVSGAYSFQVFGSNGITKEFGFDKSNGYFLISPDIGNINADAYFLADYLRDVTGSASIVNSGITISREGEVVGVNNINSLMPAAVYSWQDLIETDFNFLELDDTSLGNYLFKVDRNGNISTTGTGTFGGIKTSGGLPTSDPADGTHTLWADPITHIVYEGT